MGKYINKSLEKILHIGTVHQHLGIKKESNKARVSTGCSYLIVASLPDCHDALGYFLDLECVQELRLDHYKKIIIVPNFYF